MRKKERAVKNNQILQLNEDPVTDVQNKNEWINWQNKMDIVISGVKETLLLNKRQDLAVPVQWAEEIAIIKLCE